MDPNRLLTDVLEWARNTIAFAESGAQTTISDYDFSAAEKVLALDEWLCGGGFKPDGWT